MFEIDYAFDFPDRGCYLGPPVVGAPGVGTIGAVPGGAGLIGLSAGSVTGTPVGDVAGYLAARGAILSPTGSIVLSSAQSAGLFGLPIGSVIPAGLASFAVAQLAGLPVLPTSAPAAPPPSTSAVVGGGGVGPVAPMAAGPMAVARPLPLAFQPVTPTVVAGHPINLIGTPAQQATELANAQFFVQQPWLPSLAPRPPQVLPHQRPLPAVLGRVGQIAGGLGGGYLGAQIGGEPGAITGLEIGAQIGKGVGTEIGNVLSNVLSTVPQSYRDYLASQRGVPALAPVSVPTTLAPLVGQEYCADCDPQQLALRAQQADVKREIQVEQAQQRGQQIERQQRQIEQYQAQEQETAQTGRVPATIDETVKQKQALLEQIATELSALQQQQTQFEQTTQQTIPQAAQQTAQTPAQAPLIITPSSAQSPVATEQPVERPVTFCVGCKSMNDAFRFLNGEPSECSVIPTSGDAYGS